MSVRLNVFHAIGEPLDLILCTVALTGGGFCFLRLPLRRVKGRLPLLRNVLQLSEGIAVGIHRRVVSCLAGKHSLDFGKKLLQPVQQLLRRRAVVLGKLREQIRVLDHPPREVRGDLVHHIVLRQRYAGSLRRLHVPLHDLRFRVRAVLPHAVLYRRLPERPVLVGGQVLHPVGDLVPRHLIDGVRAVRRDLDQVFLPDVLAVGLPVHNAVHELDTHAQLLADGIQRRGRALVFGDDVPAVGIVRQPGPRRGGHGRYVRIFPCHLRPGVLQPRVVRRVTLLRRQHRRVLALGLVRLNAVQSRVVHSGKSCVHLRAAAACLPHLLIRSLPRLHKAAHGFLCAFLRLGDNRGALCLLLRCLAACKGDNFTFELADGLFRVQLYPGAGLQCLHGHRVPCNGRRLVAGDRLAPGHRLHSLRRPAVHLRRGVLPHVPVILRSGRVVCRTVGKGVHAHLPTAQNTANHSAAGKFLRRCRRVENGAVADTDKGVVPSIDGVLRGAFDHALHHFLFALVQHGVHPCFPCVAAVLQFTGQRLDTAAHFHGGVHQSVADGVHGRAEIVRAVRLCLLIPGAKYLCKGELEVRIFHHCPHTAGNGVDQPGGSRRVFRQCACLCRRAGAAGQQRRNGLRHRRHRRRTQVFKNLRRFPAACRVFCVPLLHTLRLRVNSPVPAVEKPVAGVRVPVAV